MCNIVAAAASRRYSGAISARAIFYNDLN